MSGSWGQYLNGKSSHYNFSYKDETSAEEVAPTAANVPVAVPVPIPTNPNTMPAESMNKKRNNKNKPAIPAIKGGKRRTLRRRKTKSRKNYK